MIIGSIKMKFNEALNTIETLKSLPTSALNKGVEAIDNEIKSTIKSGDERQKQLEKQRKLKQQKREIQQARDLKKRELQQKKQNISNELDSIKKIS